MVKIWPRPYNPLNKLNCFIKTTFEHYVENQFQTKKRSNHIKVHCLLQVEILEFFENGIKTTKKLIAGFQVPYIIINHVIINNYS